MQGPGATNAVRTLIAALLHELPATAVVTDRCTVTALLGAHPDELLHAGDHPDSVPRSRYRRVHAVQHPGDVLDYAHAHLDRQPGTPPTPRARPQPVVLVLPSPRTTATRNALAPPLRRGRHDIVALIHGPTPACSVIPRRSRMHSWPNAAQHHLVATALLLFSCSSKLRKPLLGHLKEDAVGFFRLGHMWVILAHMSDMHSLEWGQRMPGIAYGVVAHKEVTVRKIIDISPKNRSHMERVTCACLALATCQLKASSNLCNSALGDSRRK